MKDIFYFLIFPGFLFTAALGLLVSWMDRKISARLQWRVGPSWYQPFLEFFRLLSKPILIPKGRPSFIFLLVPVLRLVVITVISTILLRAAFAASEPFAGDLIVVLYLLFVLDIIVMLRSFASQAKFAIAYQLPFMLSIFVPVIIAGGTIKFAELISLQETKGVFILHPSGAIAFSSALLCMQARLLFAPFDAPASEDQIIGSRPEYSGAALAFDKLADAISLFVIPFFLAVMFLGGVDPANLTGILTGILKVIAIAAVVVFVRNASSGVRADRAIKFFLGPLTLAALAAVLLAFMGF